MKQFKDRVAVITGAASGIGLAVARKLAERGTHLAISDIDETDLKKAESELANKVKIHSSILDVADKEAWVKYTEDVIGFFGNVHILVNNAGIGIVGFVNDMKISDYERTMNIHFGGVLNGTKNFLPHLLDQEEAHISNLSSVAGLVGVPGWSAYCAAKSAIRGFTESLRLEMKDTRVGVTSVHPGIIKTNIVKNFEEPTGKPIYGSRKLGGEEQQKAFENNILFTPVETAAEAIIAGMARNKARVLIGNDAMVIDLVQRTLPDNYGILNEVAKLIVNNI